MAGEKRIGRSAKRKDSVAGAAWEVVLIDQGPLRREVGSECAAAMRRLDELRTAWNRFEREDKPSFVRWRAREFGPLLSQLRELEEQIRHQQLLVHEVEMEMRRGFYDPHTAYQRVMFRRQSGAGPDRSEPEAKASPGDEPKLSEFEQETLFQEWVRKFIGTNPDKLDDQAYATTFEAFKSHMFRSRPPETPRMNSRRPETRPAEPVPEEQPVAIDPRIKELYRLLVRRLHPDLRADGSATVSALWHEVQEAYAATDIAHLEILLALSGIESDRFSEETTMAQMRAVLTELTRAFFALQDSLRQARDDDAWGFAREGVTAGLGERVERELRANLRLRSDRLILLNRTIADWSRPAMRHVRAGNGAYGD